MIEPISNVCMEEGIFVVNDGGEKYSVSLQNILNGVNYMQYRAIFYSFRKLDGMLACSPRWMNYANSIQKPNLFFPSFMPENSLGKDTKVKKKTKFRIVYMGSLCPREMPKLLSMVFLNVKLGYKFELVIIGRQGFNSLQR